MSLRSGVLQDKEIGIIIRGKLGEGYMAEDGVAITEYCQKHGQELYSNSPGHNNSKVEWLKEAYSAWVYKTKSACMNTICWYHLLNTKGISDYQWTGYCLNHRKEFLVLLPQEGNPYLQNILCTIFCDTQQGPSFKMFHNLHSIFLTSTKINMETTTGHTEEESHLEVTGDESE